MSRPTKFRFCGRWINSIMAGTKVYGDLIHRNNKVYIQRDDDHMCQVDPDSVVQLVGYDDDKFTIYEGDEVVDNDGNVYIAKLECVVQNPNTAEYHFWTPALKAKWGDDE